MLEGDMVLRIQEDGKAVDVPIREGEIFLLPPKVPHSPQRTAGSIGLVIERVREPHHIDGLDWFCLECNEKLYEERFKMENIMTQMQAVFERFYSDPEKLTCKHCGAVMPVPEKHRS
jgi:3-hydroxyanthranilate 3,4-dioxygenase